MIHFCTYFDSKYIHKGLALYQSLVDAGDPFVLWILCFDDDAYAAMGVLGLPHVRLISRSEFEADDLDLQRIKASRTPVEYYWTCTPSLPLYVLARDETIDVVVYLDADTFFFASPAAILDELGRGSILIVPHDYADEFEDHVINGTYNVGILAFRRDAHALACLAWWRERCLEWCFSRHEDGQIGDQAYLNEFPDRFSHVVVSNNPGINAGPWNVAKYGVRVNTAHQVVVGGRPLVCYHFHSCHICTSRLALVTGFNVALPTAALVPIYEPYLASLVDAESLLARHGMAMVLPKYGFPWRYILGRIRRRQPMRHFMRIRRTAT